PPASTPRTTGRLGRQLHPRRQGCPQRLPGPPGRTSTAAHRPIREPGTCSPPPDCALNSPPIPIATLTPRPLYQRRTTRPHQHRAQPVSTDPTESPHPATTH